MLQKLVMGAGTNGGAAVIEFVNLAVPGLGGVLEATFDPSAPLGEWDFQLLDAAAPLIGSTPPMQTLRPRLERGATTDFTLLLKGGSSAELAIDFRLGFAAEPAEGAVAGAGKPTSLKPLDR